MGLFPFQTNSTTNAKPRENVLPPHTTSSTAVGVKNAQKEEADGYGPDPDGDPHREVTTLTATLGVNGTPQEAVRRKK